MSMTRRLRLHHRLLACFKQGPTQMHVHPAIAALRSDPALQRRIQAAIDQVVSEWRERPSVAAVTRELYLFDQGTGLGALPALQLLMHDHSAARDWIRQFHDAVIESLREDALGEVPLRHMSSQSFARLQLMQIGGTTLSLCVYEPVADPIDPVSAQFTDCAAYEMVIAGEGVGLFHTLNAEADVTQRVRSTARAWRAGDHIARRPCCDTRTIVNVTQTMLVLQLGRVSKAPQPSREFLLEDNRLIQQASGDKRASEQVMALAVLGALDHRAGIGAMGRFALDTDHDADARWEAIRQILAMDTKRGIDLLHRLSVRESDTLALPAVKLMQQLRVNGIPISMIQEEAA